MTSPEEADVSESYQYNILIASIYKKDKKD